jgi:hypothetical protein
LFLPQEVPLSPEWRQATCLEPSLVGSDAEPGGDVRATPVGVGMAGKNKRHEIYMYIIYTYI